MENAESKTAEHTEDPELDDLLDSALKDFSKEQTLQAKDVETSTSEPTSKSNTEESSEEAWTKDFIKQAADQLEENLQNLMLNGGGTDLEASFQRMAQSVASVITDGERTGEGDTDGSSTDFQSAIARALNDLSATSENLQSEADITEMFRQASLDDEPAALLPFMQGMVQHLLSKEILYPSLKELVDKYPEWLEEKKATISPTDFERYTKQLELMRKVCAELESEKNGDSEDVKKKRLETTMQLMEQVQSYGEFPAELVGEQSNPFQVDGDGNPVIPALLRSIDSSGPDPNSCRLM